MYNRNNGTESEGWSRVVLLVLVVGGAIWLAASLGDWLRTSFGNVGTTINSTQKR